MNHCMLCWVVATPNWVFPKIVSFPPKSSIFNRGFYYKPSILGYPYFWKHPNIFCVYPENWGRFSPNLTCAYFSDGLLQPAPCNLFLRAQMDFMGFCSLICVVCVFFLLGSCLFLIIVFSPGEFQAQEKFWGGLGGKWMHPHHIWRILIVDSYPGPWNPKMEHQQ